MTYSCLLYGEHTGFPYNLFLHFLHVSKESPWLEKTQHWEEDIWTLISSWARHLFNLFVIGLQNGGIMLFLCLTKVVRLKFGNVCGGPLKTIVRWQWQFQGETEQKSWGFWFNCPPNSYPMLDRQGFDSQLLNKVNVQIHTHTHFQKNIKSVKTIDAPEL